MPYSSAARCPARPVYQVCEWTTVALSPVDHVEVRRQRRQRRVGALESRIGLRHDHPRTRGSHAMHVDLAQMPQLRDKLGDVNPGPAVDLGWILPSHHRHPHGDDGIQKSGALASA